MRRPRRSLRSDDAGPSNSGRHWHSRSPDPQSLSFPAPIRCLVNGTSPSRRKRQRSSCDNSYHPPAGGPLPPQTTSPPHTGNGGPGRACRGPSATPVTAETFDRIGRHSRRPLPRRTQPRHQNNRLRHDRRTDRPASPPPATRPTERATCCDFRVPTRTYSSQCSTPPIAALPKRYATILEASISFRRHTMTGRRVQRSTESRCPCSPLVRSCDRITVTASRSFRMEDR